MDVLESRISIFDTGPGMDNSDENSIVKWYVYMKSFFSSFIFMFFFFGYDFLVWHFGLLFFCSQVRQKLSYA